MKRVLFAALLLIGGSSYASAQTTLGGGLVYTDLDPLGLGFQVNAYFGVPTAAPGLRLGGDFTYYLPGSRRQSFLGEMIESDLNVFELNGNAQYAYIEQEDLLVYGIGGLNLSRASTTISITGLGSDSDTETKIGLNVGGGAEVGVGFGAFYGEAKYVIASDGWGRIVLGAGLRFDR